MNLRAIDTILTAYIVVQTIHSSVLLIIHRDKISQFRLLLGVPILCFFELLQTQVLEYILPGNQKIISDLIVNLYIVIEYCSFLYFFLLYLNNKKIISSLAILILPLFTAILYTTGKYDLITIERYFVYLATMNMIVASIFLLTKIVLDDSVKTLKNNPEFLLASGVFFLYSFLAPFYAIRKYLLNNLETYVMFQTLIIVLGYSIFYTIFIYSIKCKIRQSKS